MANVTDLIKFIESSPSEDVSWGDWTWKTELSRSVPDWRSIIADPQNWDMIKEVTPIKWGGDLFRYFIEVGGLELAKRFFHSDVSDQRSAAREWLINYAPIDSSLWHALDRSMKNHLLEDRFQRWPGEPFEMLEEYNREIHHIARRVDREALPDVMRPLPYIVGYVPSLQIEKLRFIIADAPDSQKS